MKLSDMTPYHQTDFGTLYHGDCLDILPTLADKSVDCCITSPPYWGLRDYGTAEWEGGDAECEHKVGRFEYAVNEKQVSNKRSVWTVTTKPYKEAHFATYPPDLILPCVKAAKPDAVILDPFFGSGTTGLVAVQNGRRYIGIDLNPEYCNIAAKRIDNELQQADIFMGLPAQRSDK